MSRSVSSAFFTKMQEDGGKLCLLIDLETSNYDYHWTDAAGEVWYTLSGNPTKYEPFPGQTAEGIRQTNDLGVSVVDFIIANTGDLFADLMDVHELDYATVKIGRVFNDTPDLGRMDVFQGEMGDYTYDRNAIGGQIRNQWGSSRQKWPYYNYQDKCAWRFGSTGCGVNVTSLTLTFSAGNINTSSSTTRIIKFNASQLSQSYDNNRFDFGRFTVLDGPNSGSIRTIRVHTGDWLTLSHPLPVNSLQTLGFTIYPGCRKRRIADCRSIYNNDENFMGFPWIPIQEDAF